MIGENKSQQYVRSLSPQTLQQYSKQSLPGIVNMIRPKHHPVRIKKAISLQKIQYQQPITDRIRRQKQKYMRPLSDVEQIMKKFDEVANSKKSATETPKQDRKNNHLQQRFQTQLQKRMKQLLNLPTIKAIKQKAEKQRQKQKTRFQQPQTATLILMGEGMRLSILGKYDDYIKKAVKPTSKKLKTDYR